MKYIRFRFPAKIIFILLPALFLLQPCTASADMSANEILNLLSFSAEEKKSIAAGKIVERFPKEQTPQELAVALMFQVNKAPDFLDKRFMAGEGINKHKEIIGYQSIRTNSDFPVLQLTDKEQQEMDKFLAAEPGVTLNLSAEEIKTFAAISTEKTDIPPRTLALKELQKLLKARYLAYKKGGVAAIAPYQRADNTEYNLGAYFSKTNQLIIPTLSKYFPKSYQIVKDYPKNSTLDYQERFVLLQINIRDRPAFALEHRLTMQENGADIMISRYFYVSHTLNGQEEAGLLLPQGEGSLALVVTRASSDAITGFGSSTKHLIGRRMLTDDLTEYYKSVQKRFGS